MARRTNNKCGEESTRCGEAPKQPKWLRECFTEEVFKMSLLKTSRSVLGKRRYVYRDLESIKKTMSFGERQPVRRVSGRPCQERGRAASEEVLIRCESHTQELGPHPWLCGQPLEGLKQGSH